MNQYTLLLLSEVFTYFVASIIIIIVGIGLIRGKFNWGTKNSIQNKRYLKSFWMRIILPCFIILFGVYSSYDPLLDLTKKDYQQKIGVFENLSEPKSYILTFKNDKMKYMLPSRFAREIKFEKGKVYKYIYAKRTGIILFIEENKLEN